MKYPIIFLLAIALFACDECKDVSCLNGGTCNEGDCTCPTGFSGSNCQAEDRCVTNNLNCKNGKECVDGNCDCGDWYEGDDCGTKVTETHAGLDNGYWVCNVGYSSIVSFADVSAEENKMTISETGSDRVYQAAFVTHNSFDIPAQTISDQYGSPTVSGQGSFNSEGTLTLSMTYDYSLQGSSTVNCVFSGY